MNEWFSIKKLLKKKKKLSKSDGLCKVERKTII